MFNGLTINECVSWLNDVPRNSWYRDKIKNIVKNKVVFEVGCGSGILAAYCLEFGAKHYYGVDIRSHRADYTRRLLDHMGYSGKHTIFSTNFLEFDGIDEKIDILLVEQTGNQYQNNFMNRQCWQHAQEIFPYDYISLPDQWEVDVEVYNNLLNTEMLENCASRFINDPSLPTNYYETVQKVSMLQPLLLERNAFTININNCNNPVEFNIYLHNVDNATFVMQDYISFNGDRCYTASSLADWPAPIVIAKENINPITTFSWDTSLQYLPDFCRGYWKVS